MVNDEKSGGQRRRKGSNVCFILWCRNKHSEEEQQESDNKGTERDCDLRGRRKVAAMIVIVVTIVVISSIICVTVGESAVRVLVVGISVDV